MSKCLSSDLRTYIHICNSVYSINKRVREAHVAIEPPNVALWDWGPEFPAFSHFSYTF